MEKAVVKPTTCLSYVAPLCREICMFNHIVSLAKLTVAHFLHPIVQNDQITLITIEQGMITKLGRIKIT